MDKRFWAIVAAIIIIFGGIIIINNKRDDGSSDGGSSSTTNHVKGDNAKSVTLVEYGDFQCPVCSVYKPTVDQVVEKYKGDIKFQFVNFPLQQLHANAFAASRAAEAADKQGKFWEMYDKLYANQSDWSEASDPVTTFSQYAQSIGLKVDQFKSDFNSSPVNKAINADIAAGNKLKVTGTPSFFLNGKQIQLSSLVGSDNYPTLEKFSTAIDAAIKEQSSKQ